jgi:hypothetical protein
MTRERRRDPRYDVEVRVEVWRDDRLVAELATRNLSTSGLFLFYPKGAPLGDFLSLKLSLGESAPLTVMGEVVHSIPDVGMGIRFFDMDDKSKDVLSAFLSRVQ